jgi:hypothetical protein
MSTQAQAGGRGSRSHAGGQCAKDRATARDKKINLSSPWLVLAKGNKSLVPRRWCQVRPKKEKGRFGVGAQLRGQILDRLPILRGSVGPSKAPLAYRPTSSLRPCPTPRARCKKKKKRVGSELGRSFEVRSSIGRRSAGDQSGRVKLRSLIVLRPPCPTPRASFSL